MGLRQTEKLYTVKESNKIKRQPTKWEKVLSNDISDRELTSKFIKNSYRFTHTQTPIKNWAENLDRHFSQENRDSQFNITNLQENKTTIRYQLTPVRVIVKKTKTGGWRGRAEKGPLVHCPGLCKLVQPLWKVWRLPPKLTIELYDPAIPLLGVYPKKTKTLLWKDMGTPVFTVALIFLNNSQDKEVTQVLTDDAEITVTAVMHHAEDVLVQPRTTCTTAVP